jgi:hypothetical protein
MGSRLGFAGCGLADRTGLLIFFFFSSSSSDSNSSVSHSFPFFSGGRVIV